MLFNKKKKTKPKLVKWTISWYVNGCKDKPCRTIQIIDIFYSSYMLIGDQSRIFANNIDTMAHKIVWHIVFFNRISLFHLSTSYCDNRIIWAHDTLRDISSNLSQT